MTTEPPLEHLNTEDAPKYVDERLFESTIDNLDMHIRRKKAIANKTRYSILYLLYEYRSVSRRRLSEETGRVGNGLQQHMKQLLDCNLIARIHGQGGDQRRTYYRITKTGEQIIASDIDNIANGVDSDSRYNSRTDSYLDTEGDDTTDQ